LYRVRADTPLSPKTDAAHPWLDGLPGDPGKFGELLGTFVNPTGASTLSHTFPGVVVYPGDAAATSSRGCCAIRATAPPSTISLGRSTPGSRKLRHARDLIEAKALLAELR
jgi:hypothetical protein